MTKPIIFGEIKGIPEGYQFQDRRIMMKDSFHRNWAGGIDGTGKTGVVAIVLSGGYMEDEDFGDTIIYTGAGGNEGNSKKQTKDQDWNNRGNAGLLKSRDEGLPVRVIRGANHKTLFSPKLGYKYAGLYSVIDAWEPKKDYQLKNFTPDTRKNTNYRQNAEGKFVDEWGNEEPSLSDIKDGVIASVLGNVLINTVALPISKINPSISNFKINYDKSRYIDQLNELSYYSIYYQANPDTATELRKLKEISSKSK